jgi:hypothetical protein
MSRCRVTNPRTLRRLSEQLGRPVVTALVRGNTGHRIDARDADGKSWSLWPDGTIEPFPDDVTIEWPPYRRQASA